MSEWSGEERRSERPNITKDDLKEIVDFAMERHLHSDSHAFVQTLMEKERRKQELWDKAKAHVLGWGLVAVLGYFIVQGWEHIVAILKGN